MSGLRIDRAVCIGCGKCVKACDRQALEIKERKAALDGKRCVLCGICVDVCPVKALSLEREGQETADLSGWKDVWVFAQQKEGELLPVSLELTGKGRELADARGCRLVALLPGDSGTSAGQGAGKGEAEPAGGQSAHYETRTENFPGNGGVQENAGRLFLAGADEVIFCRDSRLRENPADLLADWIRTLAEERRPEILLFGATSLGRELAPTVAAMLQTGLTADCTGLEIDPETGLLQQTRPAFGGNLMATILCPGHRPQMATVRAGVFPVPEAAPEGQPHRGELTEAPLADGASSLLHVLETVREESGGSVARAEILVDVGRGIGSRKNLPLMKRLAELLGGQLGCSRPLVEAGWCEYSCQVGQTGASVAPRLLICVGVSGAIQHLAGIGGAGTILAINSDPQAPIFGVSHYGIVGDCTEVVKEMVALLEAENPRP